MENISYNVTVRPRGAPSGTCQVVMTVQNQLLTAAFTLIFCVSIIGNGLVIVTIVQQRWMRTVTNLYLLNLAISDLLLICICMPPTLLAVLIECFIFGSTICSILTFLQPVSVTASAYTLTIIAIERYFAICRPLHSRHWQTKSHAAKMILLTWALSITCNSVSFFIFSNNKLYEGRYNCAMKRSLTRTHQQMYMVGLTVVAFLVPLFLMAFLYALVIRTLASGMRIEAESSVRSNGDIASTEDTVSLDNGGSSLCAKLRGCVRVGGGGGGGGGGLRRGDVRKRGAVGRRGAEMQLRSTHMEKNLLAKKRVIRMLVVVVSVFFICWTPHYVNTILTISGYHHDYGFLARTYVLLTLAYLSTCTNPICYCFFNLKFRQAFLLAFGCRRYVQQRYAGFPLGGGTDRFHSAHPYNRQQPTITFTNTATTSRIMNRHHDGHHDRHHDGNGLQHKLSAVPETRPSIDIAEELVPLNREHGQESAV